MRKDTIGGLSNTPAPKDNSIIKVILFVLFPIFYPWLLIAHFAYGLAIAWLFGYRGYGALEGLLWGLGGIAIFGLLYYVIKKTRGSVR